MWFFLKFVENILKWNLRLIWEEKGNFCHYRNFYDNDNDHFLQLLSTFQPDSIRVTRRKLQDMMKSDNLSKEFPKISEKKQNFYHEVLNQSKKVKFWYI